jgi:hypothetical protein
MILSDKEMYIDDNKIIVNDNNTTTRRSAKIELMIVATQVVGSRSARRHIRLRLLR